MAYPAVPSRRMAIDADGTIFLKWLSNYSTIGKEATAVEKALLCAESDEVFPYTANWRYQNATWHTTFIFPELREVDGVFLSVRDSGLIASVYSSGDTTNGMDGTWTTEIADYVDTPIDQAYNYYRSSITSLALASKRAVRFQSYHGNSSYFMPSTLMWYGEISPGETPDRLLYIDDATGLEFGATSAPEIMDWGDAPRGRAAEWEFKLKNNSTVAGNNLTASTIQITHEDLYGGAGGWVTYSDDGSVYVATMQITSIAPEASTVKLYARSIIPAATIPGPYAARSKVSVGSWS